MSIILIFNISLFIKESFYKLIVSHDKILTICSVAGGNNADRLIFRWVKLNTESRCFYKGMQRKSLMDTVTSD